MGIDDSADAAGSATGAGRASRSTDPSIEGNEIELIRSAVERGHTSLSGPLERRRPPSCCATRIGAQDVLLTTSCTPALEMSALLLDLEPGDTVVVPSFGFVTTALAYARQGARDPVLRHRRPDARPRSPAPRRAHGRLRAGGRADPLRGRRLRHRRHRRRARPLAPRRAGRGQRARALRPLPRSAARQLRSLRHAELPRDEELHLRRGRRPGRERRSRRRPGPRVLPQGNEPAGVPPRPGRQVLVAGRRDRRSVSATCSRRSSTGSSNNATRSSRKRRAVFDRYQQMLEPTRRAATATGSRSSPTTASRRTTCSTCCSRTKRRATGCSSTHARPWRARDVPLRPAAQLPGRAGGSRPARPACPVTDDISGRLLRLPFYTEPHRGGHGARRARVPRLARNLTCGARAASE